MARRRQSRYRRGYISLALDDDASVDELFRQLRQDAQARVAHEQQQAEGEARIDLTIPTNSAHS